MDVCVVCMFVLFGDLPEAAGRQLTGPQHR